MRAMDSAVPNNNNTNNHSVHRLFQTFLDAMKALHESYRRGQKLAIENRPHYKNLNNTIKELKRLNKEAEDREKRKDEWMSVILKQNDLNDKLIREHIIQGAAQK